MSTDLPDTPQVTKVHSVCHDGEDDLLGYHKIYWQEKQEKETPFLPQKNLHRHCFRFPLGILHVPGEIANNDYAKFWGVKEVYYGICASRGNNAAN